MNKEARPVAIECDGQGTPIGVRVSAIDESFVIALHDEPNEMTWDELKESGIKTFTKKQAAILIAYLDEVNGALRKAGGESLETWYWTMSEYSAHTACVFSGTGGTLIEGLKYNGGGVRPVLASVKHD